MPLNPITTYSVQKIEPAIRPDLQVVLPIKLPANVNYPKGTILGELTATPGTFKAYAAGNADGSQNAACVLQDNCQTDASGNVVNSSTAGQTTGGHGQNYPVAEAIFGGYVRTEDCVGLDANAVTKLGYLRRGTVAQGLLRIP